MPESNQITRAAAAFPPEFGLRAFPGRKFRIELAASFLSEAYGIQLYVYAEQLDGSWLAFAKGTPEELRREVTQKPD